MLIFKIGRYYLSLILDAFTKQILSYALDEFLKLDFALETVDSFMRKYKVT